MFFYISFPMACSASRNKKIWLPKGSGNQIQNNIMLRDHMHGA